MNVNSYLFETIPEEELDRVLEQEHCDISPDFMGFVSTYDHLSQIIPEHWTVVDFGAAYNPQSYFFTDHKKYIAVEPLGTIKEMFKPSNCSIYRMSTGEFIKYYADHLDLNETFAICNYVPPWENENSGELVREYFPNAYVFYPSNKELVKGLTKKG